MRTLFNYSRYFLFLVIIQTTFTSLSIEKNIIDKVKYSAVTIKTRGSISAYMQGGSWEGTGFIASLKNGLVITNRHVIGHEMTGNFLVSFYNGHEAEAKQIYYDLWQDFAFLKVNPKDIPTNCTELEFSNKLPTANQDVTLIGNNEAQGFSFHNGYISNIYDINGDLPQHSYVINMNTAGGSSGSPVLDKEFKVVAVNYGGGKTYALALKGEYVQKALAAVMAGEEPKRQHIGIISSIYSLDKAVKHRNFPKDLAIKYNKDYPEYRNNVIEVETIISQTPAKQFLKPGDIIWKAGGQLIGPSLFTLDNLIDNAKQKISLEIFRDGKSLSFDIPTYDINKNKINKMISFAGGIFFESDDFVSFKTGAPISTLMLVNVQPGSSLSAIPRSFPDKGKNWYTLVPETFNNLPVSNLEGLKSLIPNLLKLKYITIRLLNLQPYFTNFNHNLVFAHQNFLADIILDTLDYNPLYIKFNKQKMEWESEEIK